MNNWWRVLRDEGNNIAKYYVEHRYACATVRFIVKLLPKGMEQDLTLDFPRPSIFQIRFIEMVIDQLTARGVMDASSLYEPPFSNLDAGAPDALFAGRENVIDGIFEKLEVVNSGLVVGVG